jgi:hypothetical protein
MTKRSKTSAGKPREQKYFWMRERNSGGMDNDWYVGKRRKGFYLNVSEQGDVAGPCSTIADALSDGVPARQYAGSQVDIKTNVSLEELIGIMNMYSFELLRDNTDTQTINGVEIFIDSFKDVLAWYAEVQKRR